MAMKPAFLILFYLPLCALAQSTSSNSGTVRGTVLDPSGAAVKNAKVEIQNPVSKYNRSAETDAHRFERRF